MQAPASDGRAVVTTPSPCEIRVQRDFAGDRVRLWRCYTDPRRLARWWGRGNRLDVEAMDLRPGGRWRFVEHDGAGPVGFQGRFHEVVPPERLAYSFGWDEMPGHAAETIVTFSEAEAGRTRVVTDLLFATEGDRDGMLAAGMETGLKRSYAHLDRLLAETA